MRRIADAVTRGLPFVYAYVHDILVARTSLEEHLRHLRLLFEHLAADGVVINVSKSEFGATAVDFIGHCLDATGIRPLPGNVPEIIDFQKPVSMRKLRQFLGLGNFYRRLIRNCATLLEPLNRQLAPNAHLLHMIGTLQLKRPLEPSNASSPMLLIRIPVFRWHSWPKREKQLSELSFSSALKARGSR